MRKRIHPFILSLAILSGFLMGVSAGDDRERLTEAAKATLQRFFPAAEVEDVDEREKDDEPIWVVRLHEGEDKRDILVELARDGQILEIDEDVRVEALPERVQRAVKKAFPKAKIERAEMETEMEIHYRVDISEGNKDKRVKVRRSGRIFEIEKRD